MLVQWGFDVLYIKFLHQVSQGLSEGWGGQYIIPGYPKEGNHCHIHKQGRWNYCQFSGQ